MKGLYLCLLLVLMPLTGAFADQLTFSGVKIIAGAGAFLDEETPLDHFVIGGSGMIGVTTRLRIEPQFLYMDGPDTDRDITLTGNVTYDLYTTDHSAIYVVGGGGLIRHSQDFPVTGTFSSNDWTASGGLGVRIYLTEQFFVSPEFRLGWEPLIQIVGAAGFEF